MGGKITISPGQKGAISEHLASAWLLQQGYDVFRNISPNGRADLLAVNWDADETIRVDVKSQEFTLTAKGPRADAAREMEERNEGFDIKYLVVRDDGSCGWYVREPKAANDNELEQWWFDKRTGQRFQVPGIEMSRKQWTYFCHWTLKNYQQFIHPVDEGFVKNIAARGVGRGSIYIAEAEYKALENLRRQVFEGVMGLNKETEA